MKSIFFPSSNNAKYTLCVPWIFILWLSGLVFGMLASMSHAADSAGVLDAIRKGSAAPASLILLTGICIVVPVISVVFHVSLLGYSFVFIQGFCRGFSGCVLFQLLDSGAWLVRGLLMFSVSATTVLMLWLLIRHCRGRRTSFVADICLVSFLAFAIILCDVLFISPFLSGIV